MNTNGNKNVESKRTEQSNDSLFRTTSYVVRARQWFKPGDSEHVISEGGKNYLKDDWSWQRVFPGDWIVVDNCNKVSRMDDLEFGAKFRPEQTILELDLSPELAPLEPSYGKAIDTNLVSDFGEPTV